MTVGVVVLTGRSSANRSLTPTRSSRRSGCEEEVRHDTLVIGVRVPGGAGENIKALSLYLDHADLSFTLRVNTYLLPTSEDRARRVIELLPCRVTNGHVSGMVTASV